MATMGTKASIRIALGLIIIMGCSPANDAIDYGTHCGFYLAASEEIRRQGDIEAADTSLLAALYFCSEAQENDPGFFRFYP